MSHPNDNEAWQSCLLRGGDPVPAHFSAQTRSLFVDSQPAGSYQLDSVLCDDALCPVSFFAVGNRAAGTAPFPLPLHRLRLVEGALHPHDLDATGTQFGELLRFQPENSRSIKLSRGTDALEVTWDTFGWDTSVKNHVYVALDSLGGAQLRYENVSLLWDRAVASIAAIAGVSDVSNWTSAMAANASTELFVRYIDSDACFDLWNGITCSVSNWPVGTDDCAERLDCDTLGWTPELHGSAAVCGSSSLVGEFGSSDMCVHERSYAEAGSLCTEMGGRLCTADELGQGEGGPETCGYHSIFKWTWVDTPRDACRSSNQSMGMAGVAGEWFSFVPQVLNAHYEIQLRSAHAHDGHGFAIVGVFDAHADMVPGQPTVLTRRDDGMMLRWNASQIRSPLFVHVNSPASDSSYTIAAVLPPVYNWQRVAHRLSQQFGATQLDFASDGAVVAVDLPFPFPFFGLQHQRMWVSSFGMIMFEEPRVPGIHFKGSTTSSVLAAAGEYDLNRVGASASMRRTSTALEVSWHAPLFESDAFSDVAVVLNVNGSVLIKWSQLNLSGGGSLKHG
eukprot:COSAG04_NODE_1365_length_7074_cov_49.110394_2_plen_560_part_01